MVAAPVYGEIIEFLAGGTTPAEIVAFRPSEAARRRVSDLIQREKEGLLSPDETIELEHYLELEHIMRLARAHARHHLTTGARAMSQPN